MKDQARARAGQLAREFAQRGDATGWFEAVYTEAQFSDQAVPWADMTSNLHLVQWLDRHNVHGQGRQALVVGCGLGDDAEELAHRGFKVVAFDIAPTAIDWCKQRFCTSQVEYVVANALNPPTAWNSSFDFIFEAYTLQSLPADLRRKVIASIAGMVAAEGTLLVICRGRSAEEQPKGPPWALTKAELDVFLSNGLQQAQFEDYLDQEEPRTRRFRIEYRRDI